MTDTSASPPMKTNPREITSRLLLSAAGVIIIGFGIYVDRNGPLGRGEADPILVEVGIFGLGIVLEIMAIVVGRGRSWMDGEALMADLESLRFLEPEPHSPGGRTYAPARARSVLSRSTSPAGSASACQVP